MKDDQITKRLNEQMIKCENDYGGTGKETQTAAKN